MEGGVQLMGFADFDIMGKCKKILSAISELSVDVGEKISTVGTTVNTLAANWTATRAGYLDNIRSYTATNNTASATGTLSQKQTYTNSTLIGATGATGGTASAGTLMAKSNKLLKISFMNNVATTSFSDKMPTEALKDLIVISLSNVLLYGGNFYTWRKSGYTVTAQYKLTIDGRTYVNGEDENLSYLAIETTPSSICSITAYNDALSNHNRINGLVEPIYASSLTLAINSNRTSTTYGAMSGTLYYKQL